MKEPHCRLQLASRCYFSSPDAPTPRNFTTEMLQTLRGYQQTAPGYLAIEKEFQPQYGQLALDNSAQSMFGFTDESGVHHPGTLELQRSGTAFQRGGDISDVERLGLRSNQAFLAANPLLSRSLSDLLGRTQDSDLLRKLNFQANRDLDSGGALTPVQARMADQDVASIFADRGLYHGDQSAAAALLNRESVRSAKLNQARQFASGVQALNQGQNDFVGRASQIFSTALSDPFQAILGRASGAGGSMGSQQQIGTGARLFDPTNPYIQDIYSSNFNAQAANNIQQAQADNANKQAAISIATSLIGAGIMASDERLKKNVKRTGDKTPDNIPIKEFTYRTDPDKKRWRGLMAQDVEKVRPENVHTDPKSGVKFIDYWGLGMEPLEVAA